MRHIIFIITLFITLSASAYKMSNRGMKFIKSYEKCVLHKYKATSKEKSYTIGWGHYIKSDDPKWLKNAKTISQAEANDLFVKDIRQNIDPAINRLLKDFPKNYKFSQGFIDGLGSLIYNCGPSGVKSTRFYKHLKACRYDKKNKCINKSDLHFAISMVKNSKITAKGHIKRRYEEHKLMLS